MPLARHLLWCAKALLCLSLPAALTAAEPGVAAAADAPAFSGPATVPVAADFASEVYADPWDYANSIDLNTDDGPALNVRDVTSADGTIAFDVDSAAWISPLWTGWPGALYAGREGPVRPVVADRYSHASLRLYASRWLPASLFWDRCPPTAPAPCRGEVTFGVDQGWHTYVLPLRELSSGQQHPWAGDVVGLRLSLGAGAPTHLALDWLRLYRPDATTPDVTVRAAPAASAQGRRGDRDGGDRQGRGGVTLWWDADADPGNNTPDNPGWGQLPLGAEEGTGVFAAAAYPPGTYRFYRVSDGQTSAYSQPLTVAPAPLPMLDDPDEAGGEDYATAVTGDPWDFSQPSDVVGMDNVGDVAWADDQLHGTNAGPAPNDPNVYLRVGAPIEPERYHRLTVAMRYDGPFSLADAVGGGTHGRWSWTTQDMAAGIGAVPEQVVQTKELVTYTDPDRYTVDLHTDPREWVMEDDSGYRHGWRGGGVVTARLDVNEDRGPRRWHLDDVQLRADDEARGGAFDIRWHDNNPATAAGATVSLYYDSDDRGFDGTLLAAGVAQHEGVNGYRWDTGGLPTGRYWVYVVADGGVATGRSYSTGPVAVTFTPARYGPRVAAARIAGADRIATAVAVSRDTFPGGAGAALVANAADFSDALAAAPLAAAAGGPVLLNPSGRLDGAVAAEIRRLDAESVYLMGGVNAQSAAVEQSLRALGGVTVTRVSGPDRFQTAAAAANVAVRRWRDDGARQVGRRVLVASGGSFADALAAGALAGPARLPLLLTGPGPASTVTHRALADLGADELVVVGGRAALP
ncbi:MAG TPA: cell wall-binding repeat-containing protein, partial [Egibacteraceae bacterium]|nr:cell wall-binding repeat-containing protein [Egibacteraceae bacterium]